jgi:ABC-2 type transport system permease protein
MTGFRTLLGKELLESRRTKRLPIVVMLLALVGLSSPLLARFTPELITAFAAELGPIDLPTPTMADAIAQIIENVGQFGALAAILLAMGSVAVEKERGTAALILTKPVGRASFLLSKLAALAIVLGVATALSVVLGGVYTALLFEAPSALGLATLGLLVWLQLLAFASMTFVGSTLTGSTLAAGAVGLIAAAALAIASAFPGLGDVLPPGLSRIAAEFALGHAPSGPWTPLIVTLVIIGGSIVLAWLSFRRQEL